MRRPPSVLSCSLGLGELQACPFPDVVSPLLLLSALSSSPFHCALQDGFGQTWWTRNMTIPLQSASHYNHQEVFVWSWSHRCHQQSRVWRLFCLLYWQRLYDLLRHLSWSFPEICWRQRVRADVPFRFQLLFQTSILCCCWRGLHWWLCHRGAWWLK